jgi:rubrerythrin
MSVEFNADEIYQIAERIERNGGRFYRKVAEAASEAESRGLFLQLAAMEDVHERTFADLRAKLPPEARKPMVFDPDDEAGLYLQALADGYVFDVRADPSELLTGRETVPEVLRTAIGLEKESVVFYEGMKAAVPPDAGQAGLERIIKEELGHIGILSRLLATHRK